MPAIAWRLPALSETPVQADVLELDLRRYELATGKKDLFKEFSPADPAGVGTIETILLTPDGRSYVYSYTHSLSDLYIVDGLR